MDTIIRQNYWTTVLFLWSISGSGASTELHNGIAALCSAGDGINSNFLTASADGSKNRMNITSALGTCTCLPKSCLAVFFPGDLFLLSYIPHTSSSYVKTTQRKYPFIFSFDVNLIMLMDENKKFH